MKRYLITYRYAPACAIAACDIDEDPFSEPLEIKAIGDDEADVKAWVRDRCMRHVDDEVQFISVKEM